MKETELLFEAFGEMIYVVAMSDGVIQKEELAVVEEKMQGHPWGKSLKWSFNYEMKKSNSIEDLYKKVVFFCRDHGPDPEYDFLLDVLRDVANASSGIDEKEGEKIAKLSNELLDKFTNDLDIINAL